MKQRFEIEIADDLGEGWLNAENVMLLLTTVYCSNRNCILSVKEIKKQKYYDATQIIVKGNYICIECRNECWGKAYAHKDFPNNIFVCPKCYAKDLEGLV
jgi:hypothetical protein